MNKNYFLMCEKAEEIQKLFNPDGHNHMYGSGCIWTEIDRDSYKYDKYTKYGHQYIHITDGYLMHRFWLPTQEQLQEMGGIKTTYDFYKRCVNDYGYFNLEFFLRHFVDDFSNKSFTEFWLAFVMHEKYNKIWNGKKWIHEGGS